MKRLPVTSRREFTRGLAVVLALLIAASSIVPATAQDIAAFAITDRDGVPTNVFYVDIKGGETASVEVRFTASGAPVDVTAAVANVTTALNGGLALAPDGEALAAPATWLVFDGGPLTLRAGQSEARTVEVTVPADTAPGQYVAAVTITATEPAPIPGTGIGQVARATAALAITVPGNFDTGFQLGDPSLVTGNGTGAVVQVPVTNTGTVPVHPRGTLTLQPAADAAPIAIPVAMGSVFAGASTLLALPLAEVPPGDYGLSLDLTDPDTGATAQLDDVGFMVPGPPPGAAVSFDGIAIAYEGTPLQSVAIEVDVANSGDPVAAATLVLEVSRNGRPIEEVAIASDATLADGVSSFSTTYAPDDGYGPGLWSFRLRLEAAGPGGIVTVLAETGTIAKIDVP